MIYCISSDDFLNSALFAGTACLTLSTPTSARAPQRPARRRSCSWCPGVRTLPRSRRRCSTPPPLMPWKSASWESRSSFRSVFTTHCKDTIPKKIRNKYSQKKNCAATGKYVHRSWEYIAHRHMNVEIGTEATQFPEKEYINGIFTAVHFHELLSLSPTEAYTVRNRS